MNTRKKSRWMAFAVLLFGIIASGLRRQLYLTAVDHKGLLLRVTPMEIVLLLLTAGVLGLLLLSLGKNDGTGRYEDYRWSRVSAALGHVVMAAGIRYAVLTGVPSETGYLGIVWQWLGMAAPVCLLLAGIVRLFDRKPFFLLHVIPCLFLLAQIVNNYQIWSSDPQMQDYLFALLATLALALFGYYMAAFEADCGNERMLRFTGLAAVFLCLTELGWSSAPLLYLGGAFWALTGMCSVVPAERE